MDSPNSSSCYWTQGTSLWAFKNVWIQLNTQHRATTIHSTVDGVSPASAKDTLAKCETKEIVKYEDRPGERGERRNHSAIKADKTVILVKWHPAFVEISAGRFKYLMIYHHVSMCLLQRTFINLSLFNRDRQPFAFESKRVFIWAISCQWSSFIHGVFDLRATKMHPLNFSYPHTSCFC